jgi:hypothetical protein
VVMETRLLSEVADVLDGLWRLDERGLFDTDSGRAALLAIETWLLEWVETAPDELFELAQEPATAEPEEVPGQGVLPFGGEG